MPASRNSREITVIVPLQHHKYYLPGGDLHVIAGNMLFRVHGFFLSRDSNIFNAKLNEPVPPGQVKEGTINCPVILDGVTAEEFEILLWIFYNPKYSLYDADIETWKSILHLAHKLEFKEVKELALRELHMKRDLPLVEKVVLYQNYQVDPRHLVPLFAELCARDTTLTLEESKALGPESTFLVYSTREKLRALPSNGGRSPLPPGLQENDVFRAIESFLGMDHGSTLALQQKNATVHRRRPTMDVPTTDVPTRILTPEPSNSGDQVQGIVVAPERERMFDAIVAKEDRRHMEIGQKELIVIESREVEPTTTTRCGFSLVNSTHGGRAGAVAILVVIPARTFLLLFALSWTFLIFRVIRDFPSDLRIL